tara:strand:- start:473 stop:685 length:213 start_codon:yes stop_codon:yes gene_type:complete
MVHLQSFQQLLQQEVEEVELIITLLEMLVELEVLVVVAEHLKIILVEMREDQVILLQYHLRKVIQVDQFL